MRTATAAKTIPFDTWYQDPSTKSGSFTVEILALSEYLASVDVKAATFQRSVIKLARNPIKRRMFRDLLCGATVPPVVVAEGLVTPDDKSPKRIIVDGLQRTNVFSEVLGTIEKIEGGKEDQIEEFLQDEVARARKSGHQILSVAELLKRPIICQIWSGLTEEEMIRLFMTLNVGQQKIEPRHLLETIMKPALQMFRSWGLEVYTQIDEGRTKNANEESAKAGAKRKKTKLGDELGFRFDHLLSGMIAYGTGDAQVKTPKLVASRLDPADNQQIPDLSELMHKDHMREDFLWVLKELAPIMKEKYSSSRSWVDAPKNKPTFFVPLMAALGNYRKEYSEAPEALEGRKRDLIDICHKRDNPLWLTDAPDSLDKVVEKQQWSIGRRMRMISFHGWREYFKSGPAPRKECPISWEAGANYV